MGVYVIKMDREQFERLPAVFAELRLPDPAITDKGEIVTYTFNLSLLRRLSVDVIKPDVPDRSYDLWIPLTQAGGDLYEGLKQRGYADVRQWHESHRKS